MVSRSGVIVFGDEVFDYVYGGGVIFLYRRGLEGVFFDGE